MGCFFGKLAENSADLGYSIQGLYQMGNLREDGIVILYQNISPYAGHSHGFTLNMATKFCDTRPVTGQEEPLLYGLHSLRHTFTIIHRKYKQT